MGEACLTENSSLPGPGSADTCMGEACMGINSSLSGPGIVGACMGETCIGETSREVGLDDEKLFRGIIVEGDRSGSTEARGEARGEAPREEGLEDTDDGRDERDPWFLTALAWVRRGLTLRGTPPSRGGGWGIELFTGVFEPLRASSEDGDRASLCAWKGLRKTVFCFLGADVGLLMGEPPAWIIGLVSRLIGTKSSLMSSTKLDWNSPTARLSRRNRPIHHCPSPAFRHSIRSPSTNPKSRVVSPPHE